ncbi:MAG: GtrA family protein [Lachnospiraceae bacterium]|nr:GtrA family protein [Lachnospiraceae bacterium]
MAAKKNIKQFVLYLLVGAGATAAEWVVFYLLEERLHIYYMTATGIAFVLSTFVNWALGRIIMFQSNQGIWKELAKIYLTSIAGFLMNLLIMWIAIQQLESDEMIAKMAATGIVFFWNFIIRKLVIYKI